MTRTTGTVGYWLLTFSVFPVCLAVTFWVGRDLRRLHQRKVELGYEYLPGMVQWNSKNSIVYPLCCFFAGCAAGLLGIGGGLVLGPMLLEMNVRCLLLLGIRNSHTFTHHITQQEND